MSREQRTKINETLHRPQPAGTPTVEQRRAGFAATMASAIVPDGIRTTEVTLGSRRTLLVERADGARAGTVLYFHGGWYMVGSPETALALTGNLVARTGFRAYSLDYRLAPEHPFPAAIDDALSAYRALLEEGVDPASIVFAGDSAGGGLSVTTCLAARTAGLPMPAAIAAFSPTLDLTLSSESMVTKAGIDPYFGPEDVRPLIAAYLAGQDPNHELASPVLHADLAGFPPVLLQVGKNEVLLDDSTRMAERARAAGVDVILDVTDDVPHVFQNLAGVLDEADQALDRAALFLTQHVRAA